MILRLTMLSRVLCSSVRHKHCYKTKHLSLSELQHSLIQSAQYDKGLVVVNKPVGVSFEKGLVGEDSHNTSPVCLKTALPALCKHFNIEQLYNIKIPERNVSGVTIFADSEELCSDVKKWSRVMREKKEASDTYHALVLGHPQPGQASFQGTIALQVINGLKRVVLSDKIARNAVKRGDVKRVSVNYRTLASSHNISLVEISASRTKWNCIRAYLATQALTPVLGDSLYGGYVKHILGAPVPLDVFSKPQLPVLKLPSDVQKILDLVGRSDVVVPLHLHLSSVTLATKKQLLHYSMPYPQVFTWTLEQLGLAEKLSAVAAN